MRLNMPWHRIAALVLATTVAGAAQAQAPDPVADLVHLCSSISSGQAAKDSAYLSRTEEIMFKAAGAVPDVDNDETARSKVRAFIARRMALGRKESHLFCDNAQGMWGKPTTPMRYAIDWLQFGSIRGLAAIGFDINMVDPLSGRTMLDDMRAQMELWMGNGEDYSSVYGRFNFPPDFEIEASQQYWEFRRMGARHAAELKAEPFGPCVATRADAPAPGVPFTGNLSDSGGGPTPQAIDGAVTISPRQAACLLTHTAGGIIVLDATGDADGVPGARDVIWAAGGAPMNGRPQQLLASILSTAEQDHLGKDTPLMVYCHHVRCLLSYNVVLRAKALGYRRIFWMREGIKGWRDAGLPVQPVLTTVTRKTQ